MTARALAYRGIEYSSPDGLTLFARDYPAGENAATVPLLCLHGLTRNSADFEPVVDLLNPHFRLIVPDQRGRGRSAYDPEPDNYQVSTYIDDMFTLLDQLEINELIIIGTSMGGLMAMGMAAMQAERIKAIVLNDVGPEITQAGLEHIASYIHDRTEHPTWQAAAAHQQAIHGKYFPAMNTQDWITFAKRLYTPGHGGVYSLAYDAAITKGFEEKTRHASKQPLWPLFECINQTPCLSIRGEHSTLLVSTTVRAMANAHSSFIAVEVPAVGHAPFLNEPEAAKALLEFCKTHGSK